MYLKFSMFIFYSLVKQGFIISHFAETKLPLDHLTRHARYIHMHIMCTVITQVITEDQSIPYIPSLQIKALFIIIITHYHYAVME